MRIFREKIIVICYVENLLLFWRKQVLNQQVKVRFGQELSSEICRHIMVVLRNRKHLEKIIYSGLKPEKLDRVTTKESSNDFVEAVEEPDNSGKIRWNWSEDHKYNKTKNT